VAGSRRPTPRQGTIGEAAEVDVSGGTG